MGAEVNSLTDSEVWWLVLKPNDSSNMIKGCWVYKVKRNKNCKLVCYKACWVACGFTSEQTAQGGALPGLNLTGADL